MYAENYCKSISIIYNGIFYIYMLLPNLVDTYQWVTFFTVLSWRSSDYRKESVRYIVRRKRKSNYENNIKRQLGQHIDNSYYTKVVVAVLKIRKMLFSSTVENKNNYCATYLKKYISALLLWYFQNLRVFALFLLLTVVIYKRYTVVCPIVLLLVWYRRSTKALMNAANES